MLGPLAQLVERYYGIVEVSGSKPLRSTKKISCTVSTKDFVEGSVRTNLKHSGGCAYLLKVNHEEESVAI